MTWLLDGDVLVALCIASHEHHESVHKWYSAQPSRRFSTCCITQGTLLRVHMATAEDQTAAAAWGTLRSLSEHPNHEYWEDGMNYLEVDHRMLQGPKQVTDAWLAELARTRSARLATIDGALCALHGDVAEKIPIT